MLKELRIVGPLHNPVSGYGKAARALLAAAICAGYRVEAVESETDTLISVHVGGVVQRSKQAKFLHRERPACQEAELQEALRTRVSELAPTLIMQPQDGLAEWPQFCSGPRIGLTMTEAEPLNPLWARAAENVDLLLLPCTWNLDLFSRQVSASCELLPLCVDERLWSQVGDRQETSPCPTERPAFLFLSVFSTCERKHWRSLIQAFSEEFPGEDVGLLLKPSHYREVEQLAAWSRQRGVWIGLVGAEDLWWYDDEMAALYRSADCYVLPSCEGFGVPFVEAAMCGLPVVGLGEGGAGDFISDEVGARIESTWEPCVGHLPGLYRSGQQWATASVPDIRKALRRAYDERFLDKGDFARSKALESYSRAVIGERLHELVNVADALWTMGQLGPIRPIGPIDTALDPPVVALITTFNHIERTQALIRSLLEHGPPKCGILVVDDGSSDGTQEWCREMGAAVVQSSGHNVAHNRNLGLQFLAQASMLPEPVVVIFDNDIEVTPGWWPALREVFAENPNIGILAPAKYLPSGEIQNSGNRLSFEAGTWEMKLDRPLVWPDYVETACMAIRPNLWQILRFDEQFEYAYEDVDLCFQAREIGWDIASTNRARVIHHAHTTTTESDTKSEEKRLAFLRKWKDQL